MKAEGNFTGSFPPAVLTDLPISLPFPRLHLSYSNGRQSWNERCMIMQLQQYVVQSLPAYDQHSSLAITEPS